MPSRPPKVTASAGGVVLNARGMVLVINQNKNSWSLPKGHIEPGEEPLDAAVREIMEESGVADLEFLKILGTYGRYKIGKNIQDDKLEWKLLIFFLFKTGQNELKPQDPHHPEARWVAPDEVVNLLTHPKDKAFFKSIRSQIGNGSR
ncbi:MAG: NUDIX domain-containing protein [Candidatus Omnitrophica bacterium]|nr:NUDIX domain-containing protein [Candidatus Omnitrophota bacterium]MDE2009615.1 NUDIX domain-containing protein [Candidatus Omnitrophota bacterium]MDE2214457.1 NUDIX domain-containing protein [Candidatus Omnitrophota bacterium]MDE2231597.1 NUDIX domain-containing protein [Candidatus Omnitrophota bacterium]